MALIPTLAVLLSAVLAALWLQAQVRARRSERAATQAKEAEAESMRRLRLAGGELREAALALAGARPAGPAGAPWRGLSTRLLDLAGLLLEHSETAPPARRLEEAPVALGTLLDFVLAQVAAQLGSSRRVWRVAPELAGMRLLADRRALHQILLRVISAAALATREDDWIEIAPAAHPNGWALAIEDEGLGLAISGLAERGPESRGIGLGLTLARDLMQAHGGALVLETAQQVGTRALLVFPSERLLSAEPRQKQIQIESETLAARLDHGPAAIAPAL